MSKPSLPMLAACIFLVACGDDDKSSDGGDIAHDAATDAGHTSTDAATDGSTTPPHHDGGDAGTSNDASTVPDSGTTNDAGDGFDPTLACAPGTYVPAPDFTMSSGPNHASDCFGNDFNAAGAAGVFSMALPSISISDVELATPMTVGHPYASSYEYEFAGATGLRKLEFWGTTARCGAGSQATLLATTPVVPGKNVFCLGTTPQVAYSHLLLVYRLVDDTTMHENSTLVLHGATFCDSGSCPQP